MTPGAVVALGIYAAFLGYLLHHIVDMVRDREDAQDRQMAQLLALGDRFWSDEEETDAAFCRTLEAIQNLPVANPWDVA